MDDQVHALEQGLLSPGTSQGGDVMHAVEHAFI